MERYERQIKIPQFGGAGQEKLHRATVAVVGAGGLGSPVLTYLAMAGVGRIRIIDGDIVSLSNLNRQFLHTERDIGRAKALSAAEKITAWNSEVVAEAIQERLTAKNAKELLQGAAVVADCVDNGAARKIVANVCKENGIPLIEAGISGFYGYVTVFGKDGEWPEMPADLLAAEQTQAAALGTTAGVVGALQANECLKMILDAGESLCGRMLWYDGLDGSCDELLLQKGRSGKETEHGGEI